MKIECACGRVCDSRVFKQHGRKCDAMLQEWADNGNDPRMLDERSSDRRAAKPIHFVPMWSPT